jgi:hypothetical protein
LHSMPSDLIRRRWLTEEPALNQRFKNKCRNGPGLCNEASTFEEATTLRV